MLTLDPQNCRSRRRCDEAARAFSPFFNSFFLFKLQTNEREIKSYQRQPLMRVVSTEPC